MHLTRRDFMLGTAGGAAMLSLAGTGQA
ncbi:twin-arginine translocation signal domain-containing protein [Paracoccus halophilus]